jgi:thiamine-monophosphate kinase
VRRGALLAGGDDYELCFTAPAARTPDVGRAAQTAGVPVTRIGRMVARRRSRPLVTVFHRAKPLVLAHAGFDHFRNAGRRSTRIPDI